MKYMGSKRAMLGNGLGELLSEQVPQANRFIDLFAGSGAVAAHVASKYQIPVLAFDLQRYAAILAGAVINRQAAVQWEPSFRNWIQRAKELVVQQTPPKTEQLTIASVAECRSWCAGQVDLPITKAYGGHYFSPSQALWFDALRASLPARQPLRTVALAALIQAGSKCAAAPGHTAQPFQPTETAKRFLAEAWMKDVVDKTRQAFESLAEQFALEAGQAFVGDANTAAEELEVGDLAFIDPPYSGVHYSRFYHVLETIARGSCGDVTGVGRYPDRAKRPRSKYSVTSESGDALEDLLETIATRGACAILTFPDHDCSNGLSGESVREIAHRHFQVHETQVASRFSTLGGTGYEETTELGRDARQHASELMLVLEPL